MRSGKWGGGVIKGDVDSEECYGCKNITKIVGVEVVTFFFPFYISIKL